MSPLLKWSCTLNDKDKMQTPLLNVTSFGRTKIKRLRARWIEEIRYENLWLKAEDRLEWKSLLKETKTLSRFVGPVTTWRTEYNLWQHKFYFLI